MTQYVTSASDGSTTAAGSWNRAGEPSVGDVAEYTQTPAGTIESMHSRRSKHQLPVIEIFGPTIQGEGPLIGVRTLFVRFGYCDYRCSWCDSKMAVIPKLIMDNAEWLTQAEIAHRLVVLGQNTNTQWVTVSGGNPALQPLMELVDRLHANGMKVAVETQGSRGYPWLGEADWVVLSPKPPSSGMSFNPDKLAEVIAIAEATLCVLKIVVMDRRDFDFAKQVHRLFPKIGLLLSVGNPDWNVDTTNFSVEELANFRSGLIERLTNITNWCLADHEMADVKVYPQMHVLMWGNKKGV